MTGVGRSRHRRPFTQRPLLLVVIGTVVCALVITIMQLKPEPASAAEAKVDGFVVSQLKPRLSLSGDVCTVINTVEIAADKEDGLGGITKPIMAEAERAGAELFQSRRYTTSNDVTGPFIYSIGLMRHLNLAELGMSKEDCTHEKAVADHRGRNLLELPAWAKRILAQAAGGAAYIGITLAVTAAFAAIGGGNPQVDVLGVAVGGCVGGFAWTWITNAILDTPNDLNAVQAAANCIVTAVVSVAGKFAPEIITAVKNAITRFFTSRATVAAITDAVELAEGAGGSEIGNSFGPAESNFSQDFVDAWESQPELPQ